MTFFIKFRFGLIDYSGTVERFSAERKKPTHYILSELTPAADDIARAFDFSAPDMLTFRQNKNPLLTQFIAVVIRKQMEAMRIDLG